jgi:predicted HicB family RNase H-like nuclease
MVEYSWYKIISEWRITMKNKKSEHVAKDQAEELVTDNITEPKKSKKNKLDDEVQPDVPKAKKIKSKKSDKKIDKQKSEKAPKEDKLTKLVVSLKKSVIKSIKQEAADDDISMNEYIGLAIEEKLAKSIGKA